MLSDIAWIVLTSLVDLVAEGPAFVEVSIQNSSRRPYGETKRFGADDDSGDDPCVKILAHVVAFHHLYREEILAGTIAAE